MSIISFGDVELTIPEGIEPNLVPKPNRKWFASGSDDRSDIPREVFGHLRWMAQKHAMNQDMYLSGFPSSLRRALVMKFAEECAIEVEYMNISRDTTESDLKQRREIVGSSVVFIDQPPVRAALYGRLLVLDGVEQAERNVLPTINNLLENREMNLDDGRFLLSQSKIDAIGSKETPTGLVPVHPSFRVIALGLPVPPFSGRTLDPPLRSRFQCRFIDELSAESILELAASEFEGGSTSKDFQHLLAFYETLRAVRSDTITHGRGGGSGIQVRRI